MSPHLEFLHMTRKFSTDNVRGVRDKYQVGASVKYLEYVAACPMQNQWKGWTMLVGRCPPVKTVPYSCPPTATDTTQCIYGEHNAKDSSLFYYVFDNDADDDLHYIQRNIPWHILVGCWGFTPLPKVNGLLWTWELKFRWSLINTLSAHRHFGQDCKAFHFMIKGFNSLEY